MCVEIFIRHPCLYAVFYIDRWQGHGHGHGHDVSTCGV